MPSSLSIQVKVQIPQGMYQDSLGNLHMLKGEIIYLSSLWTPQAMAESSCTHTQTWREDVESLVQKLQRVPLDTMSSFAFCDP